MYCKLSTSAIIALAVSFIAVFTTPATALDSFVGVNAGAPISGSTILFSDALAADIAASGCRLVRINFIGSANGWDAEHYAQYDTIISTARAHDLEILAIFSNETIWGWSQAQWNENYNTTGLNDYITDYAATAYDLINHYKDDIKLYEIWNEPSCWSQDPNSNPLNPGCSYLWPRIFANMMAEVYKECIANGGTNFFSDNGVSLVSGGLFAHDIGTTTNPASATAYAHDVYTQTDVWDAFETSALNPTGRQYPWDYFGYHFYLNQGSAVSTSELNTYFNRNISGHDNDGIRTEQLSHGDTSPIFISEFGWHAPTGVTLQMQADNLRDTYNWLKTQSFIASAMWYQWNNGDPNGQWGLVYSIGNPKPAWYEFADQCGAQFDPPIADFSAQPASGDAPLNVQFTNETTGITETYLWNFGDTQTSDSKNPQHTYAEPGDYTVTLTVTGPGGSDSESKAAYINVSSAFDFDKDNDVDLADFAIFSHCFTGSGNTTVPAGCEKEAVPEPAPSATTTHNTAIHGLDAYISTTDLIQGMTPTTLPGDLGWHEANTDPADKLPAFTDGIGMRATGFTGLLNDYPPDGQPTKSIQYDIGASTTIDSINIFSANNFDGRAFSTTVIKYSADGLNFDTLGYFQSDPSGTLNNTGSPQFSSTMVTIDNADGLPLLHGVRYIQFHLYAVDNTGGQMRDPFAGTNTFTDTNDGLTVAFVSPLIIELDIHGYEGPPVVGNIADTDNDGDVDAADFLQFQTDLNGPN